MTQNEFLLQQQKAIKEMREMNARVQNQSQSNSSPPPPPPKPLLPNFGMELPFANLFRDKDTALILGLLLILYGEKADKWLLLALVYILL